MSLSGRFVWRELNTPDPTRALAFYRRVFGWDARPMDPAEPAGYQVLTAGGEDVGGLTPPPMPEAPPMWLDYVTVDDVDARLAQVVQLGGRGLTEAFSVPGIGRMAVVADPDDAVFALFRGEEPGATDTERVAPDGTFCWSQLVTRQLDRAVGFYARVLGWTPSAPMPDGTVMMNDGATPRATIAPMPAGVPGPSSWVPYVAVADVDGTYARALEAGAGARMGGTDVPGMGRYAVFADPAGAVVALWKRA